MPDAQLDEVVRSLIDCSYGLVGTKWRHEDTKLALYVTGRWRQLAYTAANNDRRYAMSAETTERFHSFAEFYPYYLGEHADRTCRRLHFAGTTAVIGLVVAALAVGPRSLLWGVPLAGYGMAWIGHFFFEKNRPATFQHPFYSLWGDFVMYKDMLTGKIAF